MKFLAYSCLPAVVLANCAADNCLRAIRNTDRPGLADCQSFLRTSVTLPPFTTTVTRTASAVTQETIFTTSTEHDTVTDTITSTDDVTVTTTDFVESTVTNIPLSVIDLGRRGDAACGGCQGVPSYATACSGTARYSSACSCLGASPTTITVTPTPSTVTVSVTSVSTKEVDATKVVTGTPITITDTVAVTQTAATATVDVATATETVSPPFTLTVQLDSDDANIAGQKVQVFGNPPEGFATNFATDTCNPQTSLCGPLVDFNLDWDTGIASFTATQNNLSYVLGIDEGPYYDSELQQGYHWYTVVPQLVGAGEPNATTLVCHMGTSNQNLVCGTAATGPLAWYICKEAEIPLSAVPVSEASGAIAVLTYQSSTEEDFDVCPQLNLEMIFTF